MRTPQTSPIAASPPPIERGTAIVVGLVVLVAIGALAMAFVQTGAGESKLQVTRQEGLRVFYIAEAGLQDSIVNLKAGRPGAVASAEAPLHFGGGTYWVTSQDVGNDQYEVTSYASLGTQRRAIQVILAPETKPLFARALFGDIELIGKGSVFSDSYDTAAGTYASQAVNVDPITGASYALANGHLGSNGDITVNGNLTVMGDVTPGPGHTLAISGGTVRISGSTAPAPTTSPLLPFYYKPTLPVQGVVTGSRTLWGGTYHFSDIVLKSSSVLTIRGQVKIFVDSAFDVSSLAMVVVEPGASLVVHHNGSRVSLTGGGLLNKNGMAENFKLFSNAIDVKAAGNSGFYGAIYAPNATITPVGTTDIYGSFVGRSIVITGSANFHYDEALQRSSDSVKNLRVVALRRTGWAEL